MKSACLKIWLLAACFLIAAPGWSQVRKISGKILSAEDNQPLAGVRVTVKGKSNGTQTNALGDFSIDAAVTGDHTVARIELFV